MMTKRTMDEILKAVADGTVDREELKVSERVTLEKIDKSVDPPRLIETLVTEDGRVVERRVG